MNEPQETLSGRRILVVEDEYFIADDLARALAQLGAEVIGPVPTVADAMRLVAAGGMELAVLDINLQGETVLPLADALRRHGIPFVFATGYDRASIPDAYADVPCWEKPFRPEELASFLPRLARRN